jgi:hypothetical protein
MPRATVIVDVTHHEDVVASEAWFARWASALSYTSEDEGCGCCVHIWNVEGPAEALAAIPSKIKGESTWADSDERKG